MSWMGILKAFVVISGIAIIVAIFVCTLMYFGKWLDEKPWHFNKRKD